MSNLISITKQAVNSNVITFRRKKKLVDVNIYIFHPIQKYKNIHLPDLPNIKFLVAMKPGCILKC